MCRFCEARNLSRLKAVNNQKKNKKEMHSERKPVCLCVAVLGGQNWVWHILPFLNYFLILLHFSAVYAEKDFSIHAGEKM